MEFIHGRCSWKFMLWFMSIGWMLTVCVVYKIMCHYAFLSIYVYRLELVLVLTNLPVHYEDQYVYRLGLLVCQRF